nr:MAG TPA: hypothetical protein [Bacteriophage sp.]
MLLRSHLYPRNTCPEPSNQGIYIIFYAFFSHLMRLTVIISNLNDFQPIF